jgi:hypothetical protein
MVFETEPLPFWQWLPGALATWSATLGIFALAVLVLLVLAFARLSVASGTTGAGERMVEGFLAAVRDLLQISPRRVLALARLTVFESFRRRALAGLAVFAVILMFALWFLDPGSKDPAVLTIDFVLTSTSYLLLLVTLLLCAFGLPNDLKTKTIHTIVTKPVRSSEIVLGRIIGFSAIGTVILAIMGTISFVFVVRSLDHTHELTDNDLAPVETPVDSNLPPARQGRTSLVRNHRHQVTVSADGRVTMEAAQGHTHPVTIETHRGQQRYVLGPPQGQFHARVPVYGKLRFTDISGAATAKGMNVGDEWDYRRFIAGGTLATAIWKFSDVDEARFPDGLRLEMNLEVTRTRTGDIEKHVAGSFVLVNPQTQRASSPYYFESQEFVIDRHLVPRQLLDRQGASIDLFRDLVADGELEIHLACLEREQFFGVAQPDVYLLAREGSVPWNFIKGCAGIWFQMVLVTAFGVMWSTFLNSAVTMLATLGTIMAGTCAEFIDDLVNKRLLGGGAFEATVRLFEHKGAKVQLDDTLVVTTVTWADEVVRWLMFVIRALLPDFRQFGNIDYVSAGFDVPWDRLATQGVMTLAYLLPIFILAQIFFKFREVAR